jgi:hypothetical protein
MKPPMKPPMRKVKPPVPKYRYKLVTVTGSQAAGRMETALRERLSGRFGVSLFSICHVNGACDVMGDSGERPLDDANLRDMRAVVAEIKQA